MLKKRFFKTKDDCEVAFELTPEEAAEVELICEANGWSPIPMKKNKKGTFRTKIRVPRDRQFQFRYLVDQQTWTNDEAADAYLPNGFGGTNGVLDTTPAG